MGEEVFNRRKRQYNTGIDRLISGEKSTKVLHMAMAMCTRLIKFYDVGVPHALSLSQHHPDNFPF